MVCVQTTWSGMTWSGTAGEDEEELDGVAEGLDADADGVPGTEAEAW